MTREEIKTIIEGITDEQLGKMLDLNSRDIGKAKGKSEDQKAELEALKQQLAERDKTISALEEAKGNAETIQAELDKYKQAEAERKKAEEESKIDAILTQTAETALEQALEGKEFVNDFTRDHFLSELKRAISDPANSGKNPAIMFNDMVKELDGVFKNPQHEHVEIPGVTGNWESGNGDKLMRQVMGLPPVKGDSK